MTHFLSDGQCEGFLAGGTEHSVELAPVSSEHLYLRTYILAPLAKHLEGGCDAGGAYLEAVVLHIAVELVLDIMGKLYATLDIHAAVGIDLYRDIVVGPDLEVYQKTIATFQARLYELAECLSVYHISGCCGMSLYYPHTGAQYAAAGGAGTRFKSHNIKKRGGDLVVPSGMCRKVSDIFLN